MHYKDSVGFEKEHILTGDETFTTVCATCGKEIELSFDRFIEIVEGEGGFWATTMFCSKCPVKEGYKQLNNNSEES